MSEQWMCIGEASHNDRIKRSDAVAVLRMPNRESVINFCHDFFRVEENADKRIDSYNVDKQPSDPRYWTYSAIQNRNYPENQERIVEHPGDYIPYNNDPHSVIKGVEE